MQENAQIPPETVQIVRWVTEKLAQEYPDAKLPDKRPVIDELILNILSQGSSKERALEAFSAMKEEYHDWNELRLTKFTSIADIIKGVGLETLKGQRLLKILQKIFDDRSEVDLEFLHEMTTLQIRSYLGEMEGVGESTIDAILTFSLGRGHFPTNKAAARFGNRFGLLASPTDTKGFKEIIETALPEEMVALFILTLELHNENTCRSDKPKCTKCPVSAKCAFVSEKPKAVKRTKKVGG